MNLKAQAISGVKWTTMSNVITTILQLLQLVILTRFLEPSAFGLMALVMVVIGFSQAFLDMGISNAIIHKQVISKDQLSTLYWVNVLAGFTLFVIMFALTPLVASFYEEPELTELVMIVSLIFLIQPFGQQFMILWRKEMRFSEIAKIDIVNKSISLVVSVYFAYKGFGVYALVYGTLAGVVSQTMQFMYKGFKEYRPSFVFKLDEIKDVLGFGAYQMGEKSINYFIAQLDVFLIGKLLGPEVLGIYSLSKNLAMRPAQIINPILTKVAFPVLSKIQDNKNALKSVYLRMISSLITINSFIYLLIALLSKDIIYLAFGTKWYEAAPILSLLAIYYLLRSIGNPVGSLLLSQGKAKTGFWWNLLMFCITPIFILFGSRYGLIGIVLSLVVLQITMQIPAWKILIVPILNINFTQYFLPILKPIILGGSAFLVGYVIQTYITEFDRTIRIGVLLLIYLTMFGLFGWVLLPKEREYLRQRFLM